MSDHPLHPAFTHYPIAFFSTSYFLDIAYGLATQSATSSMVNQFYDFKPFLGDIARFSHYINILGLLTAIPAVVTGIMELLTMMEKQDLAKKFEKSQDKVQTASGMHPKMKVAFAHAALMDATVAVSGYNWWTRRNATGFAPSGANMILSTNILLVMFFSAFLGGQLVFEYGVGVKRAVGAKKEQ